MSTHANRVKMTVTSVASSGTGDITLNAASTGFRSFATAYGANATVDILITEGTAWEIARNCAYTHSGTTVSRGTLESSSTGSAVVFTADAVVSVIASAAFGNNAALNHVAASPTTAGVTGVVGTMHLLDISGLTASRNFTLPATAAVGDRVGVYITTGDDTHALIIIGDTGDTINGGSANTEWSRLFITNECVILRCTVANTAWVVEYDGRIGPLAYASSDASTTQTLTRNVATKITTALATEIADPASEWDATNKKFVARRAGVYAFSTFCQMTAIQDAKAVLSIIYKGGAAILYGTVTYSSLTGGAPGVVAAGKIPLVVGDEIEMYVYHEDDSINRATFAGVGRVYFQGAFMGSA